MRAPFVITETFIEAAANLEKHERAAIWNTLRKLKQDPPPPGLNVERLNTRVLLESCRISEGLRIVFCRQKYDQRKNLIFVGKHDEAYRFANNLNYGSPNGCVA